MSTAAIIPKNNGCFSGTVTVKRTLGETTRKTPCLSAAIVVHQEGVEEGQKTAPPDTYVQFDMYGKTAIAFSREVKLGDTIEVQGHFRSSKRILRFVTTQFTKDSHTPSSLNDS